jgi:hypothetical protein
MAICGAVVHSPNFEILNHFIYGNSTFIVSRLHEPTPTDSTLHAIFDSRDGCPSSVLSFSSS